MAKPPPAVIGVLTEPAPPTWWKAHRHQVLLIVGVFLGWQLCAASHGGTAAHDQHTPHRPTHSTAPSPTPPSHKENRD
ncbi:hypothetical protein [Streptomyces sp. NPDC101393]|uniref:hypothetical protein n=1 Tax=Streptomyces TaxID=1883 RepID=UPI0038303263